MKTKTMHPYENLLEAAYGGQFHIGGEAIIRIGGIINNMPSKRQRNAVQSFLITGNFRTKGLDIALRYLRKESIRRQIEQSLRSIETVPGSP
jgi:hypothetical protein